MAISFVDFTKGIDFTALGTATAGDHNTLVDGASPYIVDKGIVMVSKDSALNVPIVPNPGIAAKWKNYIWLRRLFSGSTVPLLYMWNDDATNIATYLKWQRVTADNTSVLALITALDVRLTADEITSASALATANAANANAATASLDSATAVATANGAAATALNADTDANAAQITADAALLQSTSANTAAAAASTVAGSAAVDASAALTIANDTKAVVSLNYNLALSSIIATIAHGFGITPKRIRWVLVCTTNDAVTGHVVGDEIPIEHCYLFTGGFAYVAFYTWATATNIILRLANASPYTIKTDGTADQPITLANWNARCYYSKS